MQCASTRPEAIHSVHVNSEPKPLDTPLEDGDTVEWAETIPPVADFAFGASLELAKSPARRDDDIGAGEAAHE